MTFTRTYKGSNMLKVILWMCLSVATAASTETRVFDLPSMTMMLTAKKAHNNDRKQFQQQVTTTVQDHLIEFYQEKLYSHNYASNVTINRVNLNAFYDWRQTEAPTQENDWTRTYGILGSYNCQLKLTLEFEEFAGPHLTQSQMEIFFIEAFQQDNYWTLAKKFLSDEVLAGVNDVKITVYSDGYVEAGKTKNEPTVEMDTKSESKSQWAHAIKTGISFAIFFIIVLIVLWSYVFWSVRKAESEQMKDDDSDACVTEEDTADADYSFYDDSPSPRGRLDDDEDDGSWMDNWAKAMTSIPLRDSPGKKRSPKGRRVQKQLPEHVPSLDCIQEGFDEDASVSSFKSRSSMTSETSYKSRPTLVQDTSEGTEVASLMSYDGMMMSRLGRLGGIQEEDPEPYRTPIEPDGFSPNRAEV